MAEPADDGHPRHHHYRHDHERRRRRLPRWLDDLLWNWQSYDAGFWKKLGLALRNLTWGRLRHQVCCGHPGQPGC